MRRWMLPGALGVLLSLCAPDRAFACGELADDLREGGGLTEDEIREEVRKCREEAQSCEGALVERGGEWFYTWQGGFFGQAQRELQVQGAGTEESARRRCGACAGLVAAERQDGMRECLSNEDAAWGTAFVARQVASVAKTLWLELSDPSRCFSCVVLLFVVGSVHAVGSAGFDALSGVAVVLGPVLWLLWLSVKLGRHLLGVTPDKGRSAWAEIGPGAARLAVASVLLMMSAGGGRGVYDWMVGNIVGPGLQVAMEVGAGVSRGVLAAAGSAGDVMDYARSRVTEMQSASVARLPGTVRDAVSGGGEAEGIADGVMSLAAALHTTGSMGLARAVGYLADAGQGCNTLGAVVSFLVGALLFLIFGMFLVVMGVRLIDPLLRLAVVLAVSPLLVVAWLFPATQQAAWVGLRTVLYALAFFLLAGIVYAMALQMVMISIVGPGDLAQGVEAFLADLTVGRDAVAAGCNLDIVKPVVTALMALVAMALAGQVSQIAGMFSSLNAQGGVSEAVEQRTMGFGMSAGGLAVQTAAMSAGFFGRMVGRGVGRVRAGFGGGRMLGPGMGG